MIAMLWKGILLGLGAAAPIGPVNVEIARRCLRHGFLAGFLVGCGAVTIDITYAILASLSFRPFANNRVVMAVLGVLGSLLLIYLGASCLVSAARRHDVGAGKAPTSIHRSYVTGLLMTSLNPMTLAFWLVVVPGVAGQLSKDLSRDLPWICAGVFFGAFGWVCSFSSLMSFAGRFSKRTMLRLADAAGGVMLLAFAGYAAWQVVQSLRSI